MTDFGRVGKIVSGKSDVVFMVVAPIDESYFVGKKPTGHRRVMVLSGEGYADRLYTTGEIGPVNIVTDNVEWLDD